ncbi:MULTISPECIES: ABC transporter ATP-binding protein [unclassified Amycolatopsis]|uniref:ABC transporter ATP-binding protein n=1 Tax=unclassified Amycolatopsis TaxID=2618356 RepID=UPI001C696F5E|nr:ABC transporter ATP-binding protein [Amycolatopsis sp. DSM 110486]QYN18462.1 ABC transporter ATP-binding protein [Amycolatopsis sp. DSM 110486]
MSTFTVTGLAAGYQGHPVIDGLTLTVSGGEAVALAGRNGMGKTTALKAVMALSVPRVSAGSVRFDDTELTRRKPHQIARAGIGYVPQGRRIFPSLTVDEHLDIVARPAPAGYEPWTWQRVFDLFPRLAERRHHRAGTLSGGEQQMLAIARALMTNPRLMLLDEPSEGLAPRVVRQVADIIRTLPESGVSVLLAEQDLGMVRRVADRVYFLDRGSVAAEVTSRELSERDDLLDRHLGV